MRGCGGVGEGLVCRRVWGSCCTVPQDFCVCGTVCVPFLSHTHAFPFSHTHAHTHTRTPLFSHMHIHPLTRLPSCTHMLPLTYTCTRMSAPPPPPPHAPCTLSTHMHTAPTPPPPRAAPPPAWPSWRLPYFNAWAQPPTTTDPPPPRPSPNHTHSRTHPPPPHPHPPPPLQPHGLMSLGGPCMATRPYCR